MFENMFEKVLKLYIFNKCKNYINFGKDPKNATNFVFLFLDKLWSYTITSIIFPISVQTLILYWWNLFLNILRVPNIAKLGFFYFGPILSSQVKHLHFNSDRCRTKEIRPGCFSIYHLNIRMQNVASCCSLNFIYDVIWFRLIISFMLCRIYCILLFFKKHVISITMETKPTYLHVKIYKY